MTALAWVLAALDVYRLTLLVVADKLTAPLRWRLIGHGHALRLTPWSSAKGKNVGASCECGNWTVAYASGVRDDEVDDLLVEPHRAHVALLPRDLGGWRYLLTCPWCASIYVAGPVVASGLAWSTGWGWQLTAGALAASAVTGFLARFAAPE